MRQTISYARYSPTARTKASNDREAGRGCESIEVQQSRMGDFARALGWVIGAEYADRDLSGSTTAGREQLEKAIRHVCRVRGVLLVYSLSRLSRSVKDSFALLERLQKAHASLASVTEIISTTTPFGRACFGMSAIWNQLEREQIVERTSTAMIRHQYQGNRRMGRTDRCPFGYRASAVDPAALELDPEEQATIGRIKELAATNISHREICRQLDAEGVDRRGKAWRGGHGLVASILDRA